MISGVLQPPVEYTQKPPRGTWAQRFKPLYRKRQTWPGWAFGGDGIIQGFIKIGSSPAGDCRAILLSEGSGALIDDVAITEGAYLFQHLAPGNYIALIVDTTGAWRAKAIHTVVPTP